MIPECLVLLVCDKRNHPNHQSTVHGNFFLKDGAKLHPDLDKKDCLMLKTRDQKNRNRHL